jgi:hypothetical protein
MYCWLCRSLLAANIMMGSVSALTAAGTFCSELCRQQLSHKSLHFGAVQCGIVLYWVVLGGGTR